MPKFNWDCWDTPVTPITPPTTSVSPTSVPPEPDTTCYPPRIDSVSYVSVLNIEVFFIKG
jgi:hypothetical protein